MKKFVAAVLMSLALAPMVQAKTVGGVNVPDQLKAAGADLTLNGAGVRTKLMMDMYVGGLYLTAANKNGAAVVAADEPMAIRLDIISGLITSEKMSAAVLEGFGKSMGGNVASLQSQVDAFLAVFKEEIKAGDAFELAYAPGKGVEVMKNGKPVSTIDGGLAFKKALFGIWLSNDPVQEDLKESMLGG